MKILIGLTCASTLALAGCASTTMQAQNSPVTSASVAQTPAGSSSASDFPHPVGTSVPCKVPQTPQEFADLAGNSTVAVTAQVSTPARVVQKLPDTNVIGFPLSEVKVVAGDATNTINEVDFNLVPGASPLSAGHYLLFLSPATRANPPQYFASYGLQGVFLIQGSDVHPLCVDPAQPGTVTVDPSSASLDSVLNTLSAIRLSDPSAVKG